jgi:hypothetical protein
LQRPTVELPTEHAQDAASKRPLSPGWVVQR